MIFFSNKITIFLFVLGLLTSCKKEIESPEQNFLQTPAVSLHPKSSTNQVVVHNNYTLSYNEKHEQAEWVAYTLKQNYGKGNNFDRPFFTSNISPQKHNFNEGVWNRLEQKIRYWATKYGEVYVVTGGVLTDGLKTIGKEKVSVPNYFYKIVATKNNGKLKMIAFLVPHKESKQPLYTFVVPVDSIEKMTKVDFFPQLENKLENQLEKNKDYKDWSFN